MAWVDVDRAEKSTLLPTALGAKWRELRALHAANRDIVLVADYRFAVELLAAVDPEQKRVEICTAYSPTLARRFGGFRSQVSVLELGIDIYCPGYGSMLLQGVYARPDLFSAAASRLNNYGLLDPDEETLTSYIERYLRIEEEADLEAFESVLESTDRIEMGRVSVENPR